MNEWLKKNRGISFEEVVIQIELGNVVATTENPHQSKYPNQHILIVNIEGYAHIVPFVEEGIERFLKTIIPSRKATKKYLRGE